jgi:hypothetical protein
MVVGGGASAYDLLDLCFEHAARRVVWVYRQPRWMSPTRKPKNQSGGPRGLAKPQMEGVSVARVSAALHADMIGRYGKLGLNDILPEEPFDLAAIRFSPGAGGCSRTSARSIAIAARLRELSAGASSFRRARSGRSTSLSGERL